MINDKRKPVRLGGMLKDAKIDMPVTFPVFSSIDRFKNFKMLKILKLR